MTTATGLPGWRTAMIEALYGPNGFFRVHGGGPAAHFRTSVHASPLFTAAVLRLVQQVDAALGRPTTFELVDVGAGHGELLSAVAAAAPRALAQRLRLTAVEVAPRPRELPAGIAWTDTLPDGIVGLLIATEWLDNVPLDVAELGTDGQIRRVLVDPATGTETLGGPVDADDRFWLARWWPLQRSSGRPTVPGTRAEIGWTRDRAWADAVATVRHGCALAIDYGHLRAARPTGTLTGYRAGRQVRPVPDGNTDITAHVAMDAVAAAAGHPYRLCSQRDALRALGVDGGRPALDLARTDPAGYLRALATASAAAELTDRAGLGGHWWLLHAVGVNLRGIMPDVSEQRSGAST